MKPFWLVLALVALLAAWRLRALGRIGRTVAVVAAALFVLVGAGVIDLPSVESIVEEVGGRLGDWTYLLVGVNAFLETGAFLGFIAPGETVVLFGGVLAGAGNIELVPLIAVVWISSMLGDLASYLIGRRYGRGFLLRHGERVKIGEPQVRFVEGFFVRHGDLTVLIGRWIGVVRPLVPFLAGSSRLPFVRFAAVDVVATFLWSTALCVLGSVFWQNFDQVVALVSRTLFVLATIVFVGAAIAFAVATRRSERRSATVERWLARQRDQHSMVARPATALWATITRLEPHVPGSRARRPSTAEAGSVPGRTDAAAGDPHHDPTPDDR